MTEHGGEPLCGSLTDLLLISLHAFFPQRSLPNLFFHSFTSLRRRRYRKWPCVKAFTWLFQVWAATRRGWKKVDRDLNQQKKIANNSTDRVFLSTFLSFFIERRFSGTGQTRSGRPTWTALLFRCCCSAQQQVSGCGLFSLCSPFQRLNNCYIEDKSIKFPGNFNIWT